MENIGYQDILILICPMLRCVFRETVTQSRSGDSRTYDTNNKPYD